MVPFEVACARCGHDLHGRSEPICPACKLEFDWSEAVPIEELTCAHCDYHLFGLQETRCPECGIEFTWKEALAEYHRKRLPLFEYRWRERPVRSFIGTCFRSLRPARFWSKTDIHAPVRVGPLIAFAGGGLLIYCLAFMFLLSSVQWLNSWHAVRRWGFMPTPGFMDFASNAYRNARSPELWAFLISVPTWALAVLGSLMVFRQSMHQCKLRNAHVIRVWAYTTTVFPILIVIGFFCTMAIEVFRTGLRFREPPLVILVSIVIAFTFWAIHVAYRRYLHMPHSLGVAAASQVMALLLASICDLFIATTWSRGGLFVQMYVQIFTYNLF